MGDARTGGAAGTSPGAVATAVAYLLAASGVASRGRAVVPTIRHGRAHFDARSSS